MQINFYTNKENFIELFEWIKNKFKNIKFYDRENNVCLDEQLLYFKTTGYNGLLVLTDENSALSEKMKINKLDFSEGKFPFLWKSGIELSFGYSDETVYEFDFSTFNPYKDICESFYRCRFYLDTYYLSDNVMYKTIFNKICGKIRRNSIHINGMYVKDYLYVGKNK